MAQRREEQRICSSGDLDGSFSSAASASEDRGSRGNGTVPHGIAAAGRGEKLRSPAKSARMDEGADGGSGRSADVACSGLSLALSGVRPQRPSVGSLLQAGSCRFGQEGASGAPEGAVARASSGGSAWEGLSDFKPLRTLQLCGGGSGAVCSSLPAEAVGGAKASTVVPAHLMKGISPYFDVGEGDADAGIENAAANLSVLSLVEAEDEGDGEGEGDDDSNEEDSDSEDSVGSVVNDSDHEAAQWGMLASADGGMDSDGDAASPASGEGMKGSDLLSNAAAACVESAVAQEAWAHSQLAPSQRHALFDDFVAAEGLDAETRPSPSTGPVHAGAAAGASSASSSSSSFQGIIGASTGLAARAPTSGAPLSAVTAGRPSSVSSSSPAPGTPGGRWPQALALIRDVWGYPGARPGQGGAIQAALAGRDALVCLPTGLGKTLCYTVPSLLAEGLTVVVSPLTALMRDQVGHARARGLPVACLAGDASEDGLLTTYSGVLGPVLAGLKLSREECAPVVTPPPPIYAPASSSSSVASTAPTQPPRPTWSWSERIKLLYVTPERLVHSGSLLACLRRVAAAGRLSRFVVDEAHCVAHSSPDFRPELTQLGALRVAFPGVPLTAVTATAPLDVRLMIASTLKLNLSRAALQGVTAPAASASSVAGASSASRSPSSSSCDASATALPFPGSPPAVLVANSADRPNIFYEARCVPDSMSALVREAAAFLRHPSRAGTRGIVYALSRGDTEKLANGLNAALGPGTAQYFHAGIASEDEKARRQGGWARGDFPVMVATSAFGMGIDAAGVRWVLHCGLPRSLLAYAQEAGRAGRDGAPAHALLLWSPSDHHAVTAGVRRSLETQLARSSGEARTTQALLDELQGAASRRQPARPKARAPLLALADECEAGLHDPGPLTEGERAARLEEMFRLRASRTEMPSAPLEKARAAGKAALEAVGHMHRWAAAASSCRRGALLTFFGDDSESARRVRERAAEDPSLTCCDSCRYMALLRAAAAPAPWPASLIAAAGGVPIASSGSPSTPAPVATWRFPAAAEAILTLDSRFAGAVTATSPAPAAVGGRAASSSSVQLSVPNAQAGRTGSATVQHSAPAMASGSAASPASNVGSGLACWDGRALLFTCGPHVLLGCGPHARLARAIVRAQERGQIAPAVASGPAVGRPKKSTSSKSGASGDNAAAAPLENDPVFGNSSATGGSSTVPAGPGADGFTLAQLARTLYALTTPVTATSADAGSASAGAAEGAAGVASSAHAAPGAKPTALSVAPSATHTVPAALFASLAPLPPLLQPRLWVRLLQQMLLLGVLRERSAPNAAGYISARLFVPAAASGLRHPLDGSTARFELKLRPYEIGGKLLVRASTFTPGPVPAPSVATTLAHEMITSAVPPAGTESSPAVPSHGNLLTEAGIAWVLATAPRKGKRTSTGDSDGDGKRGGKGQKKKGCTRRKGRRSRRGASVLPPSSPTPAVYLVEKLVQPERTAPLPSAAATAAAVIGGGPGAVPPPPAAVFTLFDRGALAAHQARLQESKARDEAARASAKAKAKAGAKAQAAGKRTARRSSGVSSTTSGVGGKGRGRRSTSSAHDLLGLDDEGGGAGVDEAAAAAGFDGGMGFGGGPEECPIEDEPFACAMHDGDACGPHTGEPARAAPMSAASSAILPPASPPRPARAPASFAAVGPAAVEMQAMCPHGPWHRCTHGCGCKHGGGPSCDRCPRSRERIRAAQARTAGAAEAAGLGAAAGDPEGATAGSLRMRMR